jgi:hypothetical protein
MKNEIFFMTIINKMRLNNYSLYNFLLITFKYSFQHDYYKAERMSDFIIGFIIGVPIGTALGIAIEVAIGIQQKPWSELTDKEKKIRKNALFVGFITLIIGVVVFLSLALS